MLLKQLLQKLVFQTLDWSTHALLIPEIAQDSLESSLTQLVSSNVAILIIIILHRLTILLFVPVACDFHSYNLNYSLQLCNIPS